MTQARNGVTYRIWNLFTGQGAGRRPEKSRRFRCGRDIRWHLRRQGDAFWETGDSGRPQTLRHVTARHSGPATCIDAVFVVQAGQVAPVGYTRDALCRVIAGGRSKARPCRKTARNLRHSARSSIEKRQ